MLKQQIQIKLDIDEKDIKNISSATQELKKNISFLKEIFGIEFYKSEICKTQHGWHLYLFTDADLSDRDICFFQMFLGSDKRREAFNWKRLNDNATEDWNILFIEKWENGKLIGKEGKRKSINLK